jgi:hypothetical protein
MKVQEADVPSRMGRVYSMAVLENIVANNKTALGRINSGVHNYTIDLTTVALEASNLRMQDKCLVCDILILDTPHGKVLESLHSANVALNFYPVGVGSLSPDGVIGADYRLVSIDVDVSKYQSRGL